MCIPISFCFEIWYLGGQNTQQPIQMTGRPSDMWARVSVMTTVNIFVRLNIFSVEQQPDEEYDTTDPPRTTLATWHLDTGWAVDMDWWQDNRFRPVSVYLSVCLYTNIKFLSRHLFQVIITSWTSSFPIHYNFGSRSFHTFPFNIDASYVTGLYIYYFRYIVKQL